MIKHGSALGRSLPVHGKPKAKDWKLKAETAQHKRFSENPLQSVPVEPVPKPEADEFHDHPMREVWGRYWFRKR